MKIKIFYSWQSDLPNSKNRGLISNCLTKAMKIVYNNLNEITDFEIISDSRGETGTPDLVSTIFSKVDDCDIFISDISIINNFQSPDYKSRLCPNPNVMIELGYAAKSIGWEKIICVINTEYSRIEDLPFDIRLRKPLSYNTSNSVENEKGKLTKLFEKQLTEIISEYLSDKKHFLKQKRTIDLALQAILIDYSSLILSKSGNNNRYNYSMILNSTKNELIDYVRNQEFLGFELYKNIIENIEDFIEFFNDDIETFFLSDKEKRIIVKLIYALKEYINLLDSGILTEKDTDKENLEIVSGNKINQDNPHNSYLLLSKLDNKKGVVLGGGRFRKEDTGKLLKTFTIKDGALENYCNCITEITRIVKTWVKETGDYFIINERTIKFNEFKKKKK